MHVPTRPVCQTQQYAQLATYVVFSLHIFFIFNQVICKMVTFTLLTISLVP